MKIMDGLVAFGSTLLFAFTLGAQTNGTAANPDGQRFLFIVDIGSSMRKSDEGTRQALFDLIYFGVDKQMKKGDTFGIWTFNDKVNAGQVPMQTWDPDKVLQQASLAAKYVQAQEFQGNSIPQAALARVSGIVRNVRDLNILMLTDGQTPLPTATFGDLVNPVYEQRSREREKVKKPFITTFIARGGQVTNASATIAGEPILIPPPTPRQPKQVVLKPKPPATNLAVAPRRITTVRKTNSTPLIIRPSGATMNAGNSSPVNSSTNGAASLVDTPTPIVHASDFIGSNEALGFTSRPPSTDSATNAHRPAAITTAAPVALAPAQNAPTISTAAPAAAITAPAPASVSNVTREARATNSTPVASANGINIFPDTPVAAREVQETAAPAPATNVRTGLSPVVLISSGAFLLVGSFVVLVFGLRRSRTASPRPSFISQSMERQ